MNSGNGNGDTPPEAVVRHYMAFAGHVLAAMAQVIGGDNPEAKAHDVLAALALDLSAGEVTLYEVSAEVLAMMTRDETRRESGEEG
jgi:hypothetical protein